MSRSKKNPKVDWFFDQATPWRAEMKKLRRIMLATPLAEELKWGKPCYALGERNVVIIQGFKEYCALLFTKGALLQDTHSILIQQTENVQAARQLRFTSLAEISELEPVIKAHIKEAVAVEKAGLEVTYKKTSEFKVPQELRERFDEDPGFKKAFSVLTPGRQRGYLLYFAAAKQSKTRAARIEKCMPKIFRGRGLQDDYRSESRR